MPDCPANDELVDRLICEGALWSPGLIAAFRHTPRHAFIDRVFQFHRKSNRWRAIDVRDLDPRALEIIYSDRALITRLGPGGPGVFVPTSSSSQPSLMAQMLEELDLFPGQRVLEIGAGTGYNAALLAAVVGPDNAFSMDVDRNMLAEAEKHLERFPDRIVHFCHGDGRRGCPTAAPFDRIIVTAATTDLEPAWLDQLSPGGLLLVPLNLAPGLSFVVRGTKNGGCFCGQLTRPAFFMSLRGENEAAPARQASQFSGPWQRRPAPWSAWFGRSSHGFYAFREALTFFGWIRGLEIHQCSSARGRPVFGVSRDQFVCWFEPNEWQFNDSVARDLCWNLWRDFLDAGGPRPTEYQLRVSFNGFLEAGENASMRVGPKTRWLWELPTQRRRPHGLWQ
jgi:protein-L-isoaspartate(D-aspartate) O-methyltransferase